MEELKIMVNETLDGVVFSLPIATRLNIKESFPQAKPVAKIFVGYDTKADFDFYHGSLERFIFPALIGLDADYGMNKINNIVFVNPVTNEIVYKIDKAEA
jgi:hypothetical protein